MDNKVEQSERLTTDKNEYKYHLYAKLVHYKELMAFLYELMTWRNPHYGHLIFLTVTFLFFLHWYLNCEVITTLAIVVLQLFLIEYVNSRNGFAQLYGKWTSEQQRHYHCMCDAIVEFSTMIYTSWSYAMRIKLEQPRIYVLIVFGSLMSLAYIGSVIHNTFLLYITALTASLTPGLLHHGILQKQFGKFFRELKMIIDTRLEKRNKD